MRNYAVCWSSAVGSYYLRGDFSQFTEQSDLQILAIGDNCSMQVSHLGSGFASRLTGGWHIQDMVGDNIEYNCRALVSAISELQAHN